MELNFLQENSLDILKMAVNFVNEQSPRNVSNIDNTTKNLIQGAALILSSASQDKNEKVNTDFFSLKMFNMKVSKNCGLTAHGLDFESKGQNSSVIKKGRCLCHCNLAEPLSRTVNKTKTKR